MKFSGDWVTFFTTLMLQKIVSVVSRFNWLSQVKELGLVLFALASFNGTQLGCTLVPSLASSDV